MFVDDYDYYVDDDEDYNDSVIMMWLLKMIIDYFMKDLYVCERATGMKIVFILFHFRDALFYLFN